MDIVSAIVVYILVWMLCFFIALPIGVRRAESPDLGHEPGAPVQTHLRAKVIGTTVAAGAVWLIIWLLIEADLYSFRDAVKGWIE